VYTIKMPRETNIYKRKNDHLTINLKKNVSSALTNGLESYHFVHQALPEIDLDEVDTTVQVIKKNLSFPLLISSMTGGTAQAASINQRLARAAQAFQIGMGVGSQRIGLELSDRMETFKVRKFAPDILLFANLGAIQLNNAYTIEHCQAAVDALEADGLILHLNPLQEALMENGNTNFKGLLKKIETVCRALPVPVIVKEVGWGISVHAAKKLIKAGVTAIDVAGSGGTSWSEVEKYRAENGNAMEVAIAFREWGIPTAQAIGDLHAAFPQIPFFASGGIRNGVDMAKCLALGASLVGIANPFLRAAVESEKALHDLITVIKQQLIISMFAVGARSVKDLQRVEIIKS